VLRRILPVLFRVVAVFVGVSSFLVVLLLILFRRRLSIVGRRRTEDDKVDVDEDENTATTGVSLVLLFISTTHLFLVFAFHIIMQIDKMETIEGCGESKYDMGQMKIG